MQLFFIISGFIICLPFALQHLKNERKVPIKKYFIRRFKRIEIPYFIALTFSLVYYILFRGGSFTDLLPHYVAGLTYTHNFFYFPNGGLNPLLPPSWTLELEIQFYLLAPLLSYLFIIKNTFFRYLTFIGVILAIILLIPVLHSLAPTCILFTKNFIFYYLPYFLIGMLIVDIYVTQTSSTGSDKITAPIVWDILGVVSAISTTAILSHGDWFTVLPFTLGAFVLATLRGHLLKKLFSLSLLTAFGSMTYSIYLFHEHILSISFHSLFTYFFDKSTTTITNYIGIATMTVWILILSIPFFLLVEKPFMNKKKKK